MNISHAITSATATSRVVTATSEDAAISTTASKSVPAPKVVDLSSKPLEKTQTYFTGSKQVASSKNAMPENKKPHKTRFAIASQIKLDILNDLDNKVSTIAEVCWKYGVHRNAVGGWKKQREKIRREVEEEGRAKKKCALQDDCLMRIRLGIWAFYELNESLPKSLKLPITHE